MEVAIQRFAAEGFRRTSVSDIARDAGITPATTYAYFAGKEALFEAAVDADAAAMIDGARAQMKGATVRDRWLPWLPLLVAALGQHPLAARILAGEERGSVRRLLDIPSLHALRAELAEDLRHGQQSGEVRDDVDPDALAQGIETFVLSVLMAYTQSRPPDGTRVIGIVTLLDAALRAPGAQAERGSTDQS
ncbi:MAG: TetR family transcriptional regulator [Actinomycetia bacterium]|nr:TetR family transcriptional regulator [Actinomycetes bacterium]